MNGTIDYLRFVTHDRTPGRAREMLKGLRHAMKYEVMATEPDYDLLWKDRNFWNGKTLEEYYELEIWGPLANLVANRMHATHAQYLTRIDYRVEVGEGQYTPSLVAGAMKARGTVKARYMEMASADKKNQKGRAFGGTSYYSGSPESERRLVYYQRAGSPWVCEARFQGTQARRVATLAVNRWQSAPQVAFYDCLTEAACNATHLLIEERTGLNPAILLNEQLASTQELNEARQEGYLDQMEAIWSLLDDDAKDAFISTREE